MTERTWAPITLTATDTGVLLYRVAYGPDDLPPVRAGDISDAWAQARDVAATADGTIAAPLRMFRFTSAAGPTDLALTDRDARLWADAVDAISSLHTQYGLSLCLRLLALVNAVATLSWLGPFCQVRRSGARIDPALLRVAAAMPLAPNALYDEDALRTRLLVSAPAILTSSLSFSGAMS